MPTTSQPFDLLLEGIRMAVEGRLCTIPAHLGHPEVELVEHIGMVRDLRWRDLLALDGQGVTVAEYGGDPTTDEGATAIVRYGDAYYPVTVHEQPAGSLGGGEPRRALVIATIYPSDVEWIRRGLSM